jgi:hypothetical protein
VKQKLIFRQTPDCNDSMKWGKGLSETGGYRVDKFDFIYLISICSDDKVKPVKHLPLWGPVFGRPWLLRIVQLLDFLRNSL